MDWVALAAKLLEGAAALIPVIEQAVSEGKSVTGATDPAVVEQQIASLHEHSLALTAQLDALR
jgi:hypothetical protein